MSVNALQCTHFCTNSRSRPMHFCRLFGSVKYRFAASSRQELQVMVVRGTGSELQGGSAVLLNPVDAQDDLFLPSTFVTQCTARFVECLKVTIPFHGTSPHIAGITKCNHVSSLQYLQTGHLVNVVQIRKLQSILLGRGRGELVRGRQRR